MQVGPIFKGMHEPTQDTYIWENSQHSIMCGRACSLSIFSLASDIPDQF